MNKIVIVLAISLLLTGCSQKVNNPYADIELNPCPMCGEQVSIGDYRYGYWIYCDNCLLHTGNYESLNELVKTWNNVESGADNDDR
jgi:hypothetical protein